MKWEDRLLLFVSLSPCLVYVVAGVVTYIVPIGCTQPGFDGRVQACAYGQQSVFMGIVILLLGGIWQ